ncbi:MFS transporter [Arenimonas terrae]|nr:MFS transporter [Arenimonas terrae]
MTAQLRRAVWWLGACQCVFWGVLYYGFSVVLVPIDRALVASQATVAGAFSCGLLLMALVAPRIGRWLDQGRGPVVVRVGAALAVSGLVALSQVGSVAGLYAAWCVLGLAMAALLYESAFALVIRAVDDTGNRLRALAAVTVMGGLASTLFLPLLALVVERLGWRQTQLVAAGFVLLAAVAMERRVFPALPSQAGRPTPAVPVRRSRREARFLALVACFSTASIAAMAVTTLLIPLLVQRGVSAPLAATVLAMLGIAQLPGRLWMLRGGAQPSPGHFAALPLGLQALGLAGMACAPGIGVAAASVAVFGLGAGLHTLARPWLVQRLYGVQAAGYWNGQVARVQGFARALGPVLAVALAAVSSAPIVLGALCVTMFALAVLAPALLREAAPADRFDDAVPPPAAAPCHISETGGA